MKICFLKCCPQNRDHLYSGINIKQYLDLSRKSHNAPVPYHTMQSFVTEMCTFLLQNGVLWDTLYLCNYCGICEMGLFRQYTQNSFGRTSSLYFIYTITDGLVQDCGNSSASAMELPQFCIKPSIWRSKWMKYWTQNYSEFHTLIMTQTITHAQQTTIVDYLNYIIKNNIHCQHLFLIGELQKKTLTLL